MAKMIRTTVDPQGNVVVDFSGFLGDECATQNARLHEGLAQLGLAVDQRFSARKGPESNGGQRLRTRGRG